MKRRSIVKAAGTLPLMPIIAGALSAGIISPAQAQEWNKAAFETKSVADAARAMGASAAPTESKDIQLTAPDIAENGAVVQLSAVSKIPGTEQIAFLVEKNPNIIAAQFMIPDGTQADVTTRVKMGQSSNVYALVKAQGKIYMTSKEVKVTLGGCGG